MVSLFQSLEKNAMHKRIIMYDKVISIRDVLEENGYGY